MVTGVASLMLSHTRRALVVAIACAACVTAGPAPDTTQGAAATSSLPDFELPSIDGDRVRLSDHVGKEVVVLSFWATTCSCCQNEMTQLDRIYAAHRGDGLALLAISMDNPGTVSSVAPFARRNNLHYPVLLDTDTKAAALYNKLKESPYTVVIDRAGRIVSETSGYEQGSDKVLEDLLVKLLPPAK